MEEGSFPSNGPSAVSQMHNHSFSDLKMEWSCYGYKKDFPNHVPLLKTPHTITLLGYRLRSMVC